MLTAAESGDAMQTRSAAELAQRERDCGCSAPSERLFSGQRRLRMMFFCRLGLPSLVVGPSPVSDYLIVMLGRYPTAWLLLCVHRTSVEASNDIGFWTNCARLPHALVCFGDAVPCQALTLCSRVLVYAKSKAQLWLLQMLKQQYQENKHGRSHPRLQTWRG